MAERINRQPGFVDAWTANLGGPRTSALLEQLDAAVPWYKLVKPVAKLPKYNGGERGGRPAWPVLMMIKCLLLAKGFGLSDPQLEECLRDRLSFRRFVGLALEDATPDETTFVRFRKRLRDNNLDRKLFDITLKHLERRGLLLKQGTLVDATIIEAGRGSKRDDGSSTRDPDAGFTKKHGRSYHGYKDHIAADRGGLVTGYRFSAATPHDSKFIDELTRRETAMVVADSAFRSVERESALTARRVVCAITFSRRSGRGGVVSDAQEIEQVDRVGACGGRTPVHADEEHGVSTGGTGGFVATSLTLR